MSFLEIYNGEVLICNITYHFHRKKLLGLLVSDEDHVSIRSTSKTLLPKFVLVNLFKIV